MQKNNERNITTADNELETVAGIVPTRSFVAADKKIREVVRKDGMLAVIGSTGLGKTTIQRISIGRLREKRYFVIEILPALLKNREATGAIAKIMIRELSGEKPCGDIIARAYQLKRILLSMSAKQRVVLVIDEAQDLHWDTMYGLKKMHELGGSNTKQFLFSIVLFGKEELSNMIRPSELGLRFMTHQMQALTIDEMKAFVKESGFKIDKKGLTRIIARTAPTPAAMEHRLTDLEYFMNGQMTLTERDIQNYFLRDLPQRVKSSGMSMSELAEKLTEKLGYHIDKSQVSRAVNFKMDNEEKQQDIHTGLSDILTEAQSRASAYRNNSGRKRNYEKLA